MKHALRRAAALVLLVLLLLSAGGCLSTDGGAKTGVNKKIFLVIQGKTIEDGGYNELCWKAVQQFSSRADIRGWGSPEAREFPEVLKKALKEKPGLVFLTLDSEYNPQLEPIIKAHPEVKFVGLDERVQNQYPNFRSINIAVQEGAMLAGYLAGRMTRTGQVGFIGGKDSFVIDPFVYGYEAGAAYAAREQQKKVQCRVRFADTFFEEEKGTYLARELYWGGCDVLFQAAGNTGLGAIKEAKRERRYIIGVDEDQSRLAPEVVLASVQKKLAENITGIITDYLQQAAWKTDDRLGLKEGATGLTTSAKLVPPPVEQGVKALEEKLIRGELTAPANKEEYTRFILALEKNPHVAGK